MGTRVALVYLAYKYPQFLRPMSFMALAISLGFMYIWANGLRQNPAEAGGEKVWWNDMRPVHSARGSRRGSGMASMVLTFKIFT
jgi:hypothetical protein